MPSVVPFVLGHGVAVDDTDSSLLARPALLAALHQAAQYQVCVLHAPTGSGKSVLIAQYLPLSRQQQPVAWLRLGLQDRDPVRFFRQLCVAIRQGVPGFAGFTSLQHHGSDPDQQATLAGQTMVDALAHLQQPLQIIIDNLDLLVDCTWLPALQRAIERSPDSVRWLLSGRNTQGIDPSRWQLREACQVFTSQQLFFDKDDAARLLNLGRKTPLDEALVERLYQHTKGWPAALKLVQVYLCRQSAGHQIPDALFGRTVFSALFNGVMESLDSGLGHFLVSTAFLERFSAPLCNYVLGIQHSEQHIDQVKRLGLFVEMDTRPGEYSLHALFRDHLVERFTQQPQPVQERLVTRACLWLVEQGHRDIACRLAYRYLPRTFFVELLRQSFREWFRAGEASPVLYWARELDQTTLLGMPEIHLAWSWSLIMFGELVLAEDIILRTLGNPDSTDPHWEALFIDTGNREAVAMAILLAFIRLFQGKMSPALLEQLQRLHNNPGLSNSHRGNIDNLFARYAIQHCRFREARQRATQVMHIMEKTGNRMGYSLAAYLIANACYQNNDIKTAGVLCRQQLDTAGMKPGATARALLEGFSAFLDYQGFQPVTAEQRFHAILVTYQPGYSADLQLCLSLPLLHMKTRRGEFESAELLLQQLEHSATASGSPQLKAHGLYERVRLAFARHDDAMLADLESQHDILQTGQALLADGGGLAWEPRERRIMAAILILLHQGELEQAHQWTQQLQYLNVDHGYPIRFLPINVCLAYLELRLGRISAAFRRLNDSLTQAEATGMLTGLLDDIPDLDGFVGTAIQQQRIQNPEHVAQLQGLGILDLGD